MKKPNVKFVRSALLLVCAAAGLVLSSCGTVNGAGQDIKNTGKAIQRAAN